MLGTVGGAPVAHSPTSKLACGASKLLVHAEAQALSLSKGLLEGSMQLLRVSIFDTHIDVTRCLSLIQRQGVATFVCRVLHMV